MANDALCSGYLATVFGTILLSQAIHKVVRATGFDLLLRIRPSLGGKDAAENKTNIWTDHFLVILAHAFHSTWVTVYAIIICIIHFDQKTENFATAFPSLFLSSFYMHELSTRHVTLDVALHHVLYPAMFIMVLQIRKTILLDTFNCLEIGHAFQFLPYILYKLKLPLDRVYMWSRVGVVGFFLIRIAGFAGVILYLALTPEIWDEFQSSEFAVKFVIGFILAGTVKGQILISILVVQKMKQSSFFQKIRIPKRP